MKLVEIINKLCDYIEVLMDIEVNEYIDRKEAADIQEKLEKIASELDDLAYNLDNIRDDIVNHIF